MLNKIFIMGRLTADPILRTTQSGISVASFSVAVDRDYAAKGEERQTDFINVVAWRNTADFISRYFSKGKMIVVDGRLQVRNYEDKDGNKRTAYEIVANNVYFGESKGTSSGNSGGGFNANHPAANQEQTGTSLSIGDIGDFEEIGDDEGLPF